MQMFVAKIFFYGIEEIWKTTNYLKQVQVHIVLSAKVCFMGAVLIFSCQLKVSFSHEFIKAETLLIEAWTAFLETCKNYRRGLYFGHNFLNLWRCGRHTNCHPQHNEYKFLQQSKPQPQKNINNSTQSCPLQFKEHFDFNRLVKSRIRDRRLLFHFRIIYFDFSNNATHKKKWNGSIREERKLMTCVWQNIMQQREQWILTLDISALSPKKQQKDKYWITKSALLKKAASSRQKLPNERNIFSGKEFVNIWFSCGKSIERLLWWNSTNLKGK